LSEEDQTEAREWEEVVDRPQVTNEVRAAVVELLKSFSDGWSIWETQDVRVDRVRGEYVERRDDEEVLQELLDVGGVVNACQGEVDHDLQGINHAPEHVERVRENPVEDEVAGEGNLSCPCQNRACFVDKFLLSGTPELSWNRFLCDQGSHR